SLRAKADEPFVSMPVAWEELASVLKSKNTAKLFFKPEAALRRMDKLGDLFEPVLSRRQKLPRALLKANRAPASLAEYRRKRDFTKTAEPAPAVIRRTGRGG